ncbi:MAG TPA: hypothetical protein VFJ10_15780 [Acidobacteriaceae bacterium]|nr:hypothetical protein [Acidobacteriaceae bacterium]
MPLVAVFFNVIVAPEIAAPVASATCPEMVPVDPCADTLAGKRRNKQTVKMQQAKAAGMKFSRAALAIEAALFVAWEFEMAYGARQRPLIASQR